MRAAVGFSANAMEYKSREAQSKVPPLPLGALCRCLHCCRSDHSKQGRAFVQRGPVKDDTNLLTHLGSILGRALQC